MSTEFYLHTDDAPQNELETQERRIRYRMRQIWLQNPQLFYLDDVTGPDPSRRDTDSDDYIHVGHIEICREMYDLIRDEPGLIIDDYLIGVLVGLLKASHEKLAGDYYSDKTYFYPSMEESEFREWLIANKGKRLLPRVD